MKAKVLLDTCVWIWASMDHPRLNKPAQDYLAEAIWCVSAISVWEVAMLVQKGRLELNMSVRQWVKQALTEAVDVMMLPLAADIAIGSCEFSMPHADPADRIILATAQHESIPLVTADKVILREAKKLHLKTYAIR